MRTKHQCKTACLANPREQSVVQLALRDGERLTATVRLRRKRGDAGAAWAVDAVEAPTDSTADGR